jgi:hypothetical protein
MQHHTNWVQAYSISQHRTIFSIEPSQHAHLYQVVQDYFQHYVLYEVAHLYKAVQVYINN